MTLLALIACSPDTTTPGAPPDTDTGSPAVEDTATLVDDTAVPEPETVTDCLLAGDWHMQIRGWVDKGWSASWRQCRTGCCGAVQTDIAGTSDISSIVLGTATDTTWTAVGEYVGGFAREPEPLVFRPIDGGWEVDGQLMPLSSGWVLTR